MGTIKTTNIEPIADNGTVTLGSSGDQFTLATGAKSSFLYPAFEAYLSANFEISSKGVAMENGVKGDTITVKNQRSKRIIEATVAGKGVVYVRL